jgi:hypothetical protein
VRRRVGTAAAVLVTVGVTVAVAGCSGSPATPVDTSESASLWSLRTPYAGDNSAVAALVGKVRPASGGGYSIRLRTGKQPYALRIGVERPDQLLDRGTLRRQAILLLGLVANLDRVSITSDTRAYSMSAAAASEDLGYDVKELGDDRSTLDAYLGADPS